MPKKQRENWEKEFDELKGAVDWCGFEDRFKSFLSQELTKAKMSSSTYREGFQAGTKTQAKLDAEDVQRARKRVIEKLNEWKEKKKIKIPSDRWQEAPEYADGNNTILQDLQDYLEWLGKEK